MTPSTRKPSKKQYEVLESIASLQSGLGTMEPVSWGTADILATLRSRHHTDATEVNVLSALRACVRHEWLKAASVAAAEGDKSPGAKIAWAPTQGGYDALERSDAAAAEGLVDASGVDQDTKEEPPVESTTQAPPVDETETDDAPWGDANEPDEESLEELDGGEVEVDDPEDEPDEVPVNAGGNQLTLAIGGPKPKSSILKIMAKQQKYGSTRQFKNMERIEFSGVLEIRGVAVDVQANGFVQRMQKAVIAELVIDGQDVTDNDE